jgi:hypothetical protein
MSDQGRLLRFVAGQHAKGNPVPAWWLEGGEFASDDCTCGMCRGRRSFNAYARFGTEPNWQAVSIWRARQEWLRTAKMTRRMIFESPPEDDPS